MSTHDAEIFATVLVGLFAWCALYARVLATHPQWYLPNNKTWVTVLLGIIWILIALGVLVYAGLFPLDALGIVILCCCAAGAPIVIWQYMQRTNHRAILKATEPRKTEEHGNGTDR
jgi:uncharacterized membrane protein